MNKTNKVLNVLKKLAIVVTSIAGICSLAGFSLGMPEIGLTALLAGLPAGSIAVGTTYILATTEAFRKTIKPGNIPEKMKISESDNPNENFEKQPIYVVSPETLGFGNTQKITTNPNLSQKEENDLSWIMPYLEEDIETDERITPQDTKYSDIAKIDKKGNLVRKLVPSNQSNNE